jgi:hypothetical protein
MPADQFTPETFAMNRDELAREAERFWREHYAAPFMRKDAEAYASVFALPSLIRAENLGCQVFRTRTELLKYVRAMLAAANETGWVRSAIDEFQVNVLEDEVATVLVRASRFDAQNRLIAGLYGSYTLNKMDGEWRMVAIFGGFSWQLPHT